MSCTWFSLITVQIFQAKKYQDEEKHEHLSKLFQVGAYGKLLVTPQKSLSGEDVLLTRLST
jgi:hypothetical protein